MFDVCQECRHAFPEHYPECLIGWYWDQAAQAAREGDATEMKWYLNKAGLTSARPRSTLVSARSMGLKGIDWVD